MRVFCYFNLHKKCFSVKALEGLHKGRVIHHASEALLHDVTFRVSEAGRQKVLAERRKNVHAGVVGQLVRLVPFPSGMPTVSQGLESSLLRGAELAAFMAEAEPISYNPYLQGSFYRLPSKQPVLSAQDCWLRPGLVLASKAS